MSRFSFYLAAFLTTSFGFTSVAAFAQDAEDTTPPQQEASQTEAVSEDMPAEKSDVSDKEDTKDQTYLPGVIMGNPDAPVVLHNFSSLTCPHCASFHNDFLPVLRREYIDHGVVSMVFHDMPLDRSALIASRLLRCLSDDSSYITMTDKLYKNQDEWAMSGLQNTDEKLSQYFAAAGMDNETYRSCLSNTDLAEKMLKTIRFHAAKYGIQSTPTLVMNDGERVIRGVGTIDGLRYMLDTRLAAEGITPPRDKGIFKLPAAEDKTSDENDSSPVEDSE